MVRRLSTHVLDVATGVPAPGIPLELRRLDPGKDPELLVQSVTNTDGRTDEPLLQGERMRPGCYELTFFVAAYFRTRAVPGLAEPPFLDRIPVVFQVVGTGAHYHVPLLVSPWSYSTYRGS